MDGKFARAKAASKGAAKTVSVTKFHRVRDQAQLRQKPAQAGIEGVWSPKRRAGCPRPTKPAAGPAHRRISATGKCLGNRRTGRLPAPNGLPPILQSETGQEGQPQGSDAEVIGRRPVLSVLEENPLGGRWNRKPWQEKAGEPEAGHGPAQVGVTVSRWAWATSRGRAATGRRLRKHQGNDQGVAPEQVPARIAGVEELLEPQGGDHEPREANGFGPPASICKAPAKAASRSFFPPSRHAASTARPPRHPGKLAMWLAT